MPYFIAITGVLGFLLTLAIRRGSQSASPIVPAAFAYGIAFVIDAWYALELPFPRLGVWISYFSRPIAGMIYYFLK